MQENTNSIPQKPASEQNTYRKVSDMILSKIVTDFFFLFNVFPYWKNDLRQDTLPLSVHEYLFSVLSSVW